MQPHCYNTTQPNGMEPRAVLSQPSEPDPGFGDCAGIAIEGAGWDPTLMTGGVFLDIDDQFANAGYAFVSPPGNLLGDDHMFAWLSASYAAAPIDSPLAGNLGDEPMFASLWASHAAAPIANPATGNLLGAEPMFASLSASYAAVPIASPAAGNLLGDEPMFASLPASYVVAPIASPAAPPTTASTLPRQPAQHRFPCTQAPCVETFARDADRVRHEKSTHFAQFGAHRCPVAGCPKSYGAGYSRPDKVTEHLRKVHSVQGKV